jgi:serine/threonine-protein kinase/endoribonuclease IRE1
MQKRTIRMGDEHRCCDHENNTQQDGLEKNSDRNDSRHPQQQQQRSNDSINHLRHRQRRFAFWQTFVVLFMATHLADGGAGYIDASLNHVEDADHHPPPSTTSTTSNTLIQEQQPSTTTFTANIASSSSTPLIHHNPDTKSSSGLLSMDVEEEVMDAFDDWEEFGIFVDAGESHPQPEYIAKEDGVIVISTVDGTLAGLSRTDGRLLWKRAPNASSSGSTTTRHRMKSVQPSESPPLLEPLVSTSTTVRRTSSSSATGSGHEKWRTAAVPSILNGIVHLTASEPDGGPDLTVTANIRDLVQRAPFVDSRGRIYTASKQTTAVAVDIVTGEFVCTIFDKNQNGKSNDESHPAASSRDENVLWMGRVDYSVTIHEPRTGELDVQFGAAELMSVHDMLLSHSNDGEDGSKPWNFRKVQHLLTGSSTEDDPYPIDTDENVFAASRENMSSENNKGSGRQHLIVTPSGNVAYRDPDTEKIMWVAQETFSTPVSFAVDSVTGTALGVEIVPDAVVPDGSIDYVCQEIQRQLDLLRTPTTLVPPVSDGTDTIVGSLPGSGELYAMPLGSKHNLGASQSIPKTSTASASALSKQQHSAIAAAGRHQQHLNFYFPESHNPHHHSFNNKFHCTAGSPHFPNCLAESREHRKGLFSEAAAGIGPFENGAVVPFYHPDYGYHFFPSEQVYLAHKQQNRYQKLFRVLGSWLPPLVALLFVSSFELGRRKRQHATLSEHQTQNTAFSTKGENTKHTFETSIIQVDEDVILGYGGHGTVVYRGTLDGRQVAVKRMLKTYHASADREISLLIESDGHPNVVRYFLKEIRGDFVYLALELCDLSLHDLIGHIRSNIDKVGVDPKVISPATKSILHQITLGVFHLHHLRIVHRDLKPANILLADVRKQKTSKKPNDNKSIFDIFQEGHYVAKISDMGLGKQLAGQSSYGGGSLLSNSSLRAQSNGGQSSIIGSGPGSVGWQAPEVMAVRMPSDASARSDGANGSNPPNESGSDVSPIDVSPSARISRSVDIFSLGCIFYSTMIPGSHPFGEWYEREANIMHDRPNIEPLREFSMEAYHLVRSMLKRNACERPTAKQIREHPFFWSSDRRISFICDFSDRIESDYANAAVDGSLSCIRKLLIVERNASQVVGTSWDRSLDDDLINNVQRFRTYDPSSVRDLLRLVRNKHHHFDELPSSLKTSFDFKTEGLMAYFEKKFPNLLIHCYYVCQELYSSDDPLLVKYSIYATKKQMHSTYSDDTKDVNDMQNVPNLVNTRDFDSTTKEAKQLSCVSAELAVVPEDAVVLENEKSIGSALIDDSTEMIIWCGSTSSRTFKCRGWNRSDEEWERRVELNSQRRDSNLVRCAEDPKFRTRLCNHWDESLGTFCPMRKKNKCVFAHGPVELRVKEAKRQRWGKLVDKNGDNKNTCHSGGEDTYGAARSVETERKQEGKWNTNKSPNKIIKKVKPKLDQVAA